jgi:hypothetical protein
VIVDIIKKLENDFAMQSGIIYFFSMNDCELLASKLVAVGIPANFCHSQLSEVGKIKAYFNWMEGLSLVFFSANNFLCLLMFFFWVCAPLSFGMGIGKRAITEYCFSIFNDIGVFLCQQMCDLLYT